MEVSIVNAAEDSPEAQSQGSICDVRHGSWAQRTQVYFLSLFTRKTGQGIRTLIIVQAIPACLRAGPDRAVSPEVGPELIPTGSLGLCLGTSELTSPRWTLMGEARLRVDWLPSPRSELHPALPHICRTTGEKWVHYPTFCCRCYPGPPASPAQSPPRCNTTLSQPTLIFMQPEQ